MTTSAVAVGAFVSSWALPAAQEAWKHRDAILSGWQRLATVFSGKTRLAVTGMSGAGKSVLLEHLSGAAFKSGYAPPRRSEAAEPAELVLPGKRMALTVVPGQQDSSPRFDALDAVFGGRHPVHGVVHVLANGFAAIREGATERRLVADGYDTVEKLRVYQREAELVELVDTAQQLRRMYRKHKRPFWMLVAVAKADLFQATLADAEAYYAPNGRSAFVARMDELSSQIGSDNFRWSALPVCSWPEDFRWNGETVASTLKTPARDHYLAAFVEAIETYARGPTP